MKTIILILAVVLSSCSQVRGPAGDPPKNQRLMEWDQDVACFGLPQTVTVKGPTRSFNSLFYMALNEEGRICVKPIRPMNGYRDEWQLLLETGLPYDQKDKKFKGANRIIAINADADEIIALSDELKLYFLRWLKNPKFPGRPGRWNDRFGWPLEEHYYITKRVLGGRKAHEVIKDPDILNWGIGRRNQIVKYFDDPQGKKHSGGGGLTSYYFLSQDGSEIYFSDSGLPADTGHTMCGPRRGTFVAKGMDVSASTMFVINQQGEMYTRMADFDTMGSDVMFFKYSYQKDVKDPDTFSLPAEDWLKQPPIELTGDATITSQVTITLTIKETGNAGRELRVVGTDEGNNPGYYYKAIYGKTWQFKQVPGLVINKKRILEPSLVVSSDLPSKDVRFPGKIKIKLPGMGNLEALVEDFNLYCSPVKLRVKEGDEEVYFNLHLVEEWYHLKRHSPGTDGTPYFTMGTLEILSATSGAKSKRGLSLLMDQDRKGFQFWAESTKNHLKLISRDMKKVPVSMEFWDKGINLPAMKMVERHVLIQDGYMEIARDPSLTMGKNDLKETLDRSRLKGLIASNKKVLRELTHLSEAANRDDKKTPFYISKKGFPFVNAVLKLLKWNGKIKTISNNVGILVERNDLLKSIVNFSSAEDLKEAQSLIQGRLKAFNQRLLDINRKVQSDWTFYEDEWELWQDHYQFGERKAQHELQGCGISVTDNKSHGLLDIQISCGKDFARYQVLAPAIRSEFMDLKNSKNGTFKVELVLRERSESFPHDLEYDFEGKLIISDGKFELTGPLKIKF